MNPTEKNADLEMCVTGNFSHDDTEKIATRALTPDAKTRRKAQYRRLSETTMAKWFTESLDFLASESVMWKKVVQCTNEVDSLISYMLRFFAQHQMDRRHSVSKILCFSRVNGQTKALRWTLVVVTGIITALIGCFVMFNNLFLAHWKYETVYEFLDNGHMVEAYFSYLGLSLTFASIAWLCCWKFPQAAESGTP